MSAPLYIPRDPRAKVRSYGSPPRRPDSWVPDRPSEIAGLQPRGSGLGVPGSDQGYALTLTKHIIGRLFLVDGENVADVTRGCAEIAMKRSGLFARSPIISDLHVACTVWGFYDATPAADLVEIRREWFEEIHFELHYPLLRRVADAVPEHILQMTPGRVELAYQQGWRNVLDLSVADD